MQIQAQSEWNKPRFQNAQPGAGFGPGAAFYAAGARPSGAEPQMAGAEVRQAKPAAKQDEFSTEKRQGHGNASTWMSMYKFFGPLVAGVGYGAILGTPIAFAAGVSFLVSSLQVAIAQKIHKEDTPWAKKLVHNTRKVMGREKDHSAAGKEWSMVPVWGAVCGMAGLTEAGINHLFAHKFPAQTIKQLNDKIETSKSYLRPIYKMQAKGMKLADETKGHLIKLSKQIPIAYIRNKATDQINKIGKKTTGRAKWAYIAGLGVAGIGGMLQSASAAKIQESIDARHAKKSQDHDEAAKPESGLADADSKSKEKPDVKAGKASPETDNKSDQRRSEEAPPQANLKTNKQSPEKHPDDKRPGNSARTPDEPDPAKSKGISDDKARPKQEKAPPQQPVVAVDSAAVANNAEPAIKNPSPIPAEKMPETEALPPQPMPVNAWAAQPMPLPPQPFMPWQTWGAASHPAAMTLPMVPPVA